MRHRRRPRWVSWAFDASGAAVLAAALVWGSLGEAYGRVGGSPTVVAHPVSYIHAGVGGYALVACSALVLAGRRSWPVTTFSVSLAAALAYTALGYVDGAVAVAPMVGLYTVAVTGSWRRSLELGALTLASLWVLNVAFGPFGLLGGGETVFPFAIATALFLGLAVGNRRAYVAGVEERAVLAERTREDEVRLQVGAERLRIARELHDVVAHSIAMINVQSGVAAHVIDERPDQAKEALVAIKGASKEALRELRSILDVLRQADDADLTAPAPGLGQLDVLVSTASAAGMATIVAVSGEAQQLPPTVDLAAYRIIQESLTNALRHAGPARTSVSLSYGRGQVVIEVADDGRGLADGAGAGGPSVRGIDGSGRSGRSGGSGGSGGSGHGITGMRERATAVGGTLEAGPRPGGGFVVTACLPDRVGS